MLIFITGYMASGKTTLGKHLAERLNYRFADLDEVIELAIGCTIADYFKRYGEDSFRKKEREILLKCLKNNRTVIATGGGTACCFDNMELMNAIGITIFIDTPAEILFERLKSENHQRPLLMGIPPEQLMEFILGHLAARSEFYNRAMIKVDGEDFDELADAVRSRLGAEHSPLPASPNSGEKSTE